MYKALENTFWTRLIAFKLLRGLTGLEMKSKMHQNRSLKYERKLFGSVCGVGGLSLSLGELSSMTARRFALQQLSDF